MRQRHLRDRVVDHVHAVVDGVRRWSVPVDRTVGGQRPCLHGLRERELFSGRWRDRVHAVDSVRGGDLPGVGAYRIQ